MATVITAFRLRDLPKSHDVKKQKCESCEVNHEQTVHSVNFDSDINSHDRSKTLRDKRNIGKLYQYDSESDDDDDDDDDFPKITYGFRKETVKETKVNSKSTSIDKTTTANAKSREHISSDEDHDEDDEDDDNVDQKDKQSKVIKKPLRLETQIKPKSNLKLTDKSSKLTNLREKSFEQKGMSLSDENDEDDDDDDDDEDDYVERKVEDKEIHLSVQKKHVYSELSKKDLKPKVPIKNLKESKVQDEFKKDANRDNEQGEIKIPNEPKSKADQIKTETKTKKPIVDTKNKDPVKSIEEILKFLAEDDDSEDEDVKNRQQSRTHIFPIRQSSKDKKEEPTKKPEKKDNGYTKPIEKLVNTTYKPVDVNKAVSGKKENKSIETKAIEKKPEDKQTVKTNEKDKKTLSSPSTEAKKVTPVDIKSPKETEKKNKETDKEISKSKPIEKKVEKEKKQTDKPDKKSTKEKVKDDKLKEDPVIAQIQKETKVEFDKKRSSKEHGQRDRSSKEKLSDSQEAYSKTESHLKHVTDALQRKNLLKSEFEDFYAFFPTFAPNYSRIHNPECRRHGQIVLRQLRGTKLWALNSKLY